MSTGNHPLAPVRPRPALRRLPPAEHGGPSGAGDGGAAVRVDFSTSVNAYGPAPSVVAAVRQTLTAGVLGAYPDPTCLAARRTIAAACDQPVETIAVGAGAAELILTTTLAFVRPGDRVLVPGFGFAEYARAAVIAGARPMNLAAPALGAPDDAVFRVVRQIAAMRPRLVHLASPESPIGQTWSRPGLRAVADACTRAEALLVLDQSFDAFASEPLGTPALAGHPSAVHLRSLTKDHALAGVRVGYAVGSPAAIAAIERARMPWTVSASAQAAAVAVCAPEAQAHLRDSVARLRDAAAGLRAGLVRLGVEVAPSDVHYLVARVGDGQTVARELRARHGLKVRDCASFGLPEYVRIAARRPEENALLLAGLAAIGVGGSPAPGTTA